MERLDDSAIPVLVTGGGGVHIEIVRKSFFQWNFRRFSNLILGVLSSSWGVRSARSPYDAFSAAVRGGSRLRSTYAHVVRQPTQCWYTLSHRECGHPRHFVAWQIWQGCPHSRWDRVYRLYLSNQGSVALWRHRARNYFRFVFFVELIVRCYQQLSSDGLGGHRCCQSPFGHECGSACYKPTIFFHKVCVLIFSEKPVY